MATKPIYLDYAAATPIDTDVLMAMLPYFTDNFYNPSATYLKAKAVAKDIAAARAQVAQVIGCRPSEIIFTAGGTEANNLAIKGIMESHPGANLIVSTIEHESVLEPAKKFDCKLSPVDQAGTVDLDKLSQLIDDQTVLISIMYANNEIGTIEPLKKIAGIVKLKRLQRAAAGNSRPLYFHTDACQAPGYLDLHVGQLGVDLMTLNGGKIYGPKQSGALYINRQVGLSPQILGGGQESNLRSGTENVAAIIGFSRALTLVQADRLEASSRITNLRDSFINQLSAKITSFQINGSLTKRLPNNLSLTFPGYDNETLLMQLDERGIECASGSACNAQTNQTSHVLKAIGLVPETAQSTLRLTLGKFTTSSDIEYTVDTLANLLNKLVCGQ